MQTAPRHIQLRIDKCLWCHEALPDGRYDRQTHDQCRIKLHRWKRKLPKACKNAINEIQAIEKFMIYDWMFCEAVDQLKLIQDEINKIYQKHNIVRVK